MNHFAPKLKRQLLAVFLILVAGSGARGQAVPVEIVPIGDGGWQLVRNGEPYFILGAGGGGSKELLAAAGANTFRTWGVGPGTQAELDEAQRLGLTVVLGHWLGHERHGFDYQDQAALTEQFERVRRDVLAYKDHPALLMWAVGNEMEGFAEGDNPAVWEHVQALAAMIRELDPYHPIMTVTADIGGQRVAAVHQLCPDIEVMGVNSYGGLPSLPERYRERGGTKPLVITEFGPPGVWEIAMTDFGAPPELTSTQKAEVYREAFTQGCLDAGGLCLGGFAFTWGFKMEATSTWYGMFLPNGDKLGAVDAMTEVWSGEPPANLCPVIHSFGLEGPDVVPPGTKVKVFLDISDPEGADVAVRWTVRGEAREYLTGGDAQVVPLELEGIISEASAEGATLTLPGGGIYRLYMVASDGSGGGATANVPIMVDGPPGSVRVKMPVVVYADGEPGPWVSSGWMGGYDALALDPESTNSPHSGATCLEVVYDAPGMWAGVVWQDPANDWGDLPGGYDLTGARKLTFWARGEEGGEKIDFGVGIIGTDKPYPDTVKETKKGVKLKREWKQYSIDLKGKDLTRVKSGFSFAFAGRGRPIVFYLDDIRYE